MAAISNSHPSSAEEKPQNPVSQVVPPSADDRQDTKLEDLKEASATSVFVNSEPIREEQVQNAVKFLSHPKVRGSPVMYRRSFLERKGLTKEEIDEAFRHVPDPPPTVTTTQPVGAAQDGKTGVPYNSQHQPPTQAMQSTPVGTVGSSSKMGILSQFHWYHAILAVGLLAASGAGTTVLFKNSIVPRLKSWIRKVVSEEEEENESGSMKKSTVKPSIAEETAAAAKAAAAAAADVARASQEMSLTRTEEKRCFEELINMVNMQVKEMKSMSNAIKKLEEVSGQSANGRTPREELDNQWISRGSSRQPYSNGKSDADSHLVRSLSPPAPVEPSVAPHPKSYTEIMAMVQRGERPPNIRVGLHSPSDINDAPPNPNQPVSNPRLAPRPKPWEANQSQSIFSSAYPTQESSNSSIHDRTANQLNGDDSSPYWQRKNVRTTEMEAGDEQKHGPQNGSVSERVQKSTWVPPQPPPVVMPEAAAAIRQPKKSAHQTEHLTDEQLRARSTNVTDELQRITKISESGGAMEINGENLGLDSTEMGKEDYSNAEA